MGFGSHGIVSTLAVVGVALWTQACATRTVYRPSLPRPEASLPRPAPPPDYYPPPPDDYPPPPQARAPIDRDTTIHEEDLRERRTAPQPRPRQEPSARALPPPGPAAPAPLSDDSSLLAKITAATSPQRAASLRLTEEGRKLLESGDHAKGLSRLEKTITVDSTNPYGYYFLAKAHYHLGRFQESLRFLDVAESLFTGNPYWLSEVFALRGEDYRALGSLERADANYDQALRLNPGNRAAAAGLNRMQGEIRPDLR